jgi:uncharacterized membrane protein (UPF0136 family)
MTLNAIILWVYIVLLLVGGLIGFLKAGSKPSLIASAVFAVALALVQLGWAGPMWVADVLLGALVIVFVIRFVKTRKFMPAGMMGVMTIIVLVLRRVV